MSPHAQHIRLIAHHHISQPYRRSYARSGEQLMPQKPSYPFVGYHPSHV